MQTIAHQLELNLWQELKAANGDPVAADLSQLWQLLEQTIPEIDPRQQLPVAAEAIAQIVAVYVLRAKAILATLELKDNSKGPILSDDFLAGLMRQSMSVNLSDLMEDIFLSDEAPHPQEPETALRSEAVPVERSAAATIPRIAKIDATQLVKELAEKERVSDWVHAIALFFEHKRDNKPVSLQQLQQSLGMPLVEVWLGMLVGGQDQYKWSQHGDFYDHPDTIFVFSSRSKLIDSQS